MAVAGGHLRVGAGQADHRDVRILEVFGTGNGNAGAVGTQRHAGTGRDDLLGGGRSLVVFGTVVRDHQFHFVLFITDLDGGGFRVGVLNAQGFLLAAGTVGTGSRLINADFDHIIRHCKGGNEQHHGQKQGNKFLHGTSSLVYVVDTLV